MAKDTKKKNLQAQGIMSEEDKSNNEFYNFTETGKIRIYWERNVNFRRLSKFITDIDSAYNSLTILENQDFGTIKTATGIIALTRMPKYSLKLYKVNINSPGFWEMLGKWNPLEFIRNYLNDRHERQKDFQYRNYNENRKQLLENDRLMLENLSLKNKAMGEMIDNFKKIGLSDRDIQKVLSESFIKQLSKLGRYQDLGIISTADTNLLEGNEGT